MYKFGILSTASITPRVIDAIRLTGNEVISIASRNLESAAAFAKKHNIANAYGSYEEIYNDKDVDVLYIPVLNSLHYECTKNALQHKKNVLLEKPFTLSKEQATELFDIAKHNECFLMEGVKNIFMPSTSFVKENLALIGTITSITSNQGTRKSFDKNHWMYKKELGGGAYVGSAAYCYHLLLNIFNCPIHLVNANLIPSHLSSDKYAEFNYTIKDIPVKSVINMEKDLDNLMVIIGEKGKIVIDTFWRSHNVKIFLNDTLLKEFKDEGNEFVYEINHVCDCLNKKMLTSDVAQYQKTIEVVSLIEQVLNSNT